MRGKCSEYSLIRERRCKRLAACLKKKVVYAKSYESAYGSVLSIFDIDEARFSKFTEMVNSSCESLLELLLDFIGESEIPTIDGAIYFHGTRTTARNFFSNGLLPLDRTKYPEIVGRILGRKSAAYKVYMDNVSWVGKPVEDVGPCAALFYESLQNYNYYIAPEALLDSLSGSSTRVKDQVAEAFYRLTVSKTVAFFRGSIEYPSETLESLLCYVLNKKTGIQFSGFTELGYDGGWGRYEKPKKIREKDIVGLWLNENNMI